MEIRLLGELEVIRGGRAVGLPASKKTRALLGYLVATETSHQRTRLCELLWDGPDDPRAALRWSLTKIRPLLDAPDTTRLAADREHVQFESRGARIDLVTVRARLGARPGEAPTEALLEVAGLLRGELLDGLDLPDCFRFHEWCVAQREAARALRLGVLDTLIERLADQPEAALGHARARIGVDPLAETGHLAVVRLLGRLGRAGEALAQYEACRRILADELGARPSPALEQARMALRATAEVVSPAATPVVATTAPVPVPATPAPGRPPTASQSEAPRRTPLVGRVAERAVVSRHVAAAIAGQARELLLVVGEPGIGKSRLLEQAVAEIRGAGGLVLLGRAYEAEAVRPFGAWIDALRSIAPGRLGTEGRADLAPLLPWADVPRPPAAAGPAPERRDEARLFDGVTRLLAELSRSAPLALVIDDLHWLDEASTGLLHYVLRTTPGSRVLIAASARPGELADNPAAVRLLRALARAGSLRELRLGPLGAPEIAGVVAAELGPGLDGARIFGESAGNPLYALEVARSLARGEGVLPASLEGIIGDRLACLDPRAQSLLPWAAALGTQFDPALLLAVTGAAAGELATGLAELERHGVIRVVADAGGDSYDFAHDLIRRVAYRRLSDAPRRMAHLQVARALAAAPDPDGTRAGEIVRHATLGRDAAMVARACVRAAERSLRMPARKEAAELASLGLQALASLGTARDPSAAGGLSHAETVHLRVELLRILVMARRGRTGANRDLTPDISAAVGEARSAGLPADEANGLYLLSILSHDGDDFVRAHRQMMDATTAARAADPLTEALVLANAGRCLVQIEREVPRAQALLTEAEALGSRLGVEVPDVGVGLGMLWHHRGDHAGARAAYQRGLRAARGERDHWREFMCAFRLVAVELEIGCFDAALARCPELDAAAAHLSEGSEPVIARAAGAVARLGAGHPGADAEVEAATLALRQADAQLMLAYILNQAAALDLAAGRLEAAEARASQALTAAQKVERPTELVAAHAALARTALARGDRAGAQGHVEAARRLLGGPDGVAARVLSALAAVADQLGIGLAAAAAPAPTPPG